jgi:hypothetical protein
MATTYHEAADVVDHVVDMMLDAVVPMDSGTAASRIDFLNGLALTAEALRAAGRGDQLLADELGREASGSLGRVSSVDAFLPDESQ